MKPRPLFGGRSLARWIEAGGRPQRHIPARRLRSAWQTWWFERNWRTEERQLESLPLPADPVLIIGLWRSGTTALHELVRTATGWATPQTWQCFNPSTCFLSAPPREDASMTRPMDQGTISALGPQEDEFALLLLGEPSVYRGFVDPRRLRECGERLWRADEGALPRWQQFVRGVAAGFPGTRLLLKSPSHTFRLPHLGALFPQAQFVWIGRHTGEVLASNLRMWSAMMQRYALWQCPDAALEEFLNDMIGACTRVLEWSLANLTRERLLWVDFEALRTDPRTVLAAVIRFAYKNADPSVRAQVAARIDPALDAVPVLPGERAELPAWPGVRELEQLMLAARARFGLVPSDDPRGSGR
jgi:omega-hydroxy-beta-dihydromenaquinone-9 sulfotransferase